VVAAVETPVAEPIAIATTEAGVEDPGHNIREAAVASTMPLQLQWPRSTLRLCPRRP